MKTVNSLINTSVDDARITLEGHLRANPTGAGIHATAGEGASVMIHLEPCPFCGQEPEQRNSKYNPYARCATPDCAGGKLPLISLDVPEDIERWNRRGREQALAAHVDGMERRGDQMAIELRDWLGSYGPDDETERMLEVWEDAKSRRPETSLARLKAEWQAEALEAMASRLWPVGLIGKGCERDALLLRASELRRQAEEAQQ